MFEIDKAILARTKCGSNFICLTGRQCPGCEVLGAGKGDFIFIKPKKDTLKCHYMTTYDDAYICQCPTRNEIYRKYGK